MSTKKQDLNLILDYFNIQIENPVTVLNQETSKNFLCSNKPTDRYKVRTLSDWVICLYDESVTAALL